jgi:hypothetical protein
LFFNFAERNLHFETVVKEGPENRTMVSLDVNDFQQAKDHGNSKQYLKSIDLRWSSFSMQRQVLSNPLEFHSFFHGIKWMAAKKLDKNRPVTNLTMLL